MAPSSWTPRSAPRWPSWTSAASRWSGSARAPPTIRRARRGQATTAADTGPPEAQVGPRFLDCQPPGAAAARGDKIEIPLPGDLGLVSGQPLRLARRRYDAVFPVPAAAVVADGDRRSVWIAGRDGTAELRQVAIVDASDDALVSDGLRVGDQVIVDPPAGLRAGTRIAPAP